MRGRLVHVMISDPNAAATETWNEDWFRVPCCASGQEDVGSPKTIDGVTIQVKVDGSDGGKLKALGSGGSGKEVECLIAVRQLCQSCINLCSIIDDLDQMYLVEFDTLYEQWDGNDRTGTKIAEDPGSFAGKVYRCPYIEGLSSHWGPPACGYTKIVETSNPANPCNNRGGDPNDPETWIADQDSWSDGASVFGDALNLVLSDDPCADGFAARLQVTHAELVEVSATKTVATSGDPTGRYVGASGWWNFDDLGGAGPGSFQITIANVNVTSITS